MKKILSIILVTLCCKFSLDAGQSKVIDALEGKTVVLEKRDLVDASESLNKDAEYVAIYYSAHWCPPCRKFTPELSKFYKKKKKKYDNFEVIFVSSDRSEDAMKEYMDWGDMEFPALAYDKISSSRSITQYAGKGIPSLVVLDRDGKVLSNSYKNGKYVGPYEVLDDLEDLLKGKSLK